MSELDSAKYWYTELIEGLRLMASEFNVQESSLPDYVHLPDEVLNALTVESFTNLVEQQLISSDQAKKILSFDSSLDELELPEDYEELLKSLESGKQFQDVRDQAKKMLEELGHELADPKIGAVYVKGS